MPKTDFVVVGAGLAGCECALALARQGFNVTLYEQKPQFRSAAHVSDGPAELGADKLRMSRTALRSLSAPTPSAPMSGRAAWGF